MSDDAAAAPPASAAEPAHAHGIAFGAAFLVWLRVAALSFGGPAGQIAVMHRIVVEEKRWVGDGRFLNALKVIDISNNLGDSKSLITHPATTTHQRLTPAERAELDITDGLVRLSIGLEDAADLKDDLAQALIA